MSQEPASPEVQLSKAQDASSAAAEEEKSPTRLNSKMAMYAVAALVLLVLSYTLVVSLGSDEETAATEEQIAEESTSRSGQAEAPGTNEQDAQSFSEMETNQTSPEVEAALQRYQNGQSQTPSAERRGEAPSTGEAGEAPRNPYGKPASSAPTTSQFSSQGSSEAAQRSQARKERRLEQAEQRRQQALEQALSTGARSSVPPPEFSSYDGPRAPSPQTREETSTGPYGRPSGSQAPDRVIRGPSLPSGSPPSRGAPPSSPAPSRPPYGPSSGAGRQEPSAASPSPYGQAGAAQQPIRSNGAEPTDTERFLANVKAESQGANRVTQVQSALSPYTLPRGTLIPIALEFEASSDLPGSIKAITTADVYDRSKQFVLVPAGSQIMTDYGQPSAVGQDRLMVAATRLTLPDGRFVNFQDVQAVDPSGTSGLKDEKDRHLLSRFGAVGALAILGTAVNIATFDERGGYYGGISAPRTDTTDDGEVIVYPPSGPGYGPPDFRTAAGRSFASQINKVLGQMLERAIDREPTLRLNAGLQGRLLLGQDINMGRPYYREGSDIDRVDRMVKREEEIEAQTRFEMRRQARSSPRRRLSPSAAPPSASGRQ